ncbi:cysteine protease StiP family protein [Thiorhodospira sibirica]|uniref:cysteine protease StiP family protein n=1 Tax=Thiorhodospira sibirica TaxID=154347 RepID=UPI00022C1D45|nr:cysteine protease StiP family protein [Thiorhodospira sibirica]
MFSGSYRPDDVEFLLKPIQIEYMSDLALKESLIQSGARHYSEMLSPETLPSRHYLALFHQAHQDNREQLAGDCLKLAYLLYHRYGADLTLVSLARAGTPIGVIVRHLLSRLYGINAAHYSISIIRDRGIDTVALNEILSRGHRPESMAFVDGWTGKGVISQTLTSAIQAYNQQAHTAIAPGLNVLTDLAGTAAQAASSHDYLISSSILNATISGLLSRSILNEAIGPKDYHGCVFFSEFAAEDLSRWFVDDVVAAAMAIFEREGISSVPVRSREAQVAISQAYMKAAMAHYGISDANLIKPGIGEATRVLLRRMPQCVIVRNTHDRKVAHLLALAADKGVPVEMTPSLPYNAVSIIRSKKQFLIFSSFFIKIPYCR